jgi:hypothetical protein
MEEAASVGVTTIGKIADQRATVMRSRWSGHRETGTNHPFTLC